MARATWKDTQLAEADPSEIQLVEGNVYFPPDSVDRSKLEVSDHRTTCPWKGQERYFHVVVDGDRLQNAAWCYPDPKPAASRIKDHIAFWKGVEVER